MLAPMRSGFCVGLFKALLLAFLVGRSTAQEALQGPFRPGTGNWTVVKGGGFEIPPGPLVVSATYILDGTWFVLRSLGSSGSASVDPVAAARGGQGVVIRPGVFDGPGIGLTLGATLRLPSGVPHVLSAWVRRPNPSLKNPQMYLDLWDAPGDISVPIPARPGWQFVYGVFTPTSADVGIRAVVDGNVTELDELHVDEMAITPLSEFRPPEPLLAFFNVRFGTADSPILRGPAAYGESTNDFWNHYSRDDGAGGFKTPGLVSPLIDASGQPSAAFLAIDNAAGAWGSGLSHPLLQVYLYPLGGLGRITLTVTNLPTGSYDAYLYGHGGPLDSFNSAFTVMSGPVSYGTRVTTTNASWRLPEWIEGAQFVRFTNVFVTRSEALVILADKDAQSVPSLNGLQIVRRSTERFRVGPESTTFRGALQVIAQQDPALVLRYSTNGTVPSTNSPILPPVLLLTNSVQLAVQAFESNQPVGALVRREFGLIPQADDGIPADWRIRYFGFNAWSDPRSQASADPDGDGTSNLDEFKAGSHPLDPLDGFLSSARQVPSLQWNSVAGVTYRVLRKDRLSDAQWTEVRRIRAVAARTEFVDSTVDGQPRFYRIEPVR